MVYVVTVVSSSSRCRVVWWLCSQCKQGGGQVTSGVVVVGRVEMVDGVCGHCGVVVIALRYLNKKKSLSQFNFT